jgi:hypothetical protein
MRHPSASSITPFPSLTGFDGLSQSLMATTTRESGITTASSQPFFLNFLHALVMKLKPSAIESYHRTTGLYKEAAVISVSPLVLLEICW